MEDIKPFLCRLEHGDPSGHSVMVVAIYATLSQIYIREYRITGIKKKVIWGLFYAIVIAVGFSRIYNGVHTYN